MKGKDTGIRETGTLALFVTIPPKPTLEPALLTGSSGMTNLPCQLPPARRIAIWLHGI